MSLGRRVALKTIRPEQLFFPSARERFEREVRTVALLRHPSIVPVYAVGDEAGVPYFAMEWIEGRTLSELLSELGGRDPATLSGRDAWLALARAKELDPGAGDPPALFAGSCRHVLALVDYDDVPPGVFEVVAVLEVALERVYRDDAPVEMIERVMVRRDSIANARKPHRVEPD